MLRTLFIWLLQSVGFDPRRIFTFYDGRWYRHIDPMVTARKLWSVTVQQESLYPDFPDMVTPDTIFDSDAARKLIASAKPEEIQRGYRQISEAVQKVFDIKPLVYGGLTELECAQLLDRFEMYLGIVKKNGSPTPISPVPTDSTDESATNNDLDSSSISIDNCFEQPESSDSEQRAKTVPPEKCA